jgi:hypothetical protein
MCTLNLLHCPNCGRSITCSLSCPYTHPDPAVLTLLSRVLRDLLLSPLPTPFLRAEASRRVRLLKKQGLILRCYYKLLLVAELKAPDHMLSQLLLAQKVLFGEEDAAEGVERTARQGRGCGWIPIQGTIQECWTLWGV